MTVFETECVECGRRYEFASDEGNPYRCPECDAERRERIAESFRETAAMLAARGRGLRKGDAR